MKTQRTTLVGSILALSVGLLVGCGTTTSSPATNSKTNTTNSVNRTTTGNKARTNNTTNDGTSKSNSSNPTNKTGTPPNSTGTGGSGTGAGTGTGTSSGTMKPVILTLENVQITDTGITLMTTHGAMTTAYANAHLVSGNQPQFTVLLRNMKPGNYAVGRAITFTNGCVKSMQLTQSGNNLVATFNLTKNFKSFNIGVGGGTEIGITFGP